MIDKKMQRIIVRNLVEALTEYGEQKGIDFWNMSPEEFEKEVTEFLRNRDRPS